MSPDPVGGREAEIEAVARAITIRADPQANWQDFREEAEAAIAALDEFRGSGSAARNQEWMIEDAKAYAAVVEALWPYWSRQESMTAAEAVTKLLAE